jgi:hypothetical protein
MLYLRHVALSLTGLVLLAHPCGVWAGWHSVFQVCCHNCSTPAASTAYYVAGYDAGCCPQTVYYQPICCSPCPQVVATTNYVQRTYYQPVTTYVTQTYYEPHTTYRTTYYYEPVTSMRYSCYFDPCTCTFRRVATPYTTYRLRSQCCPVTTYVQRVCRVPVTTYQKCCYWEAQTCYSLVDPCTGRVISSGTTVPAVPSPGVAESPAGGLQPGVGERPAVPAPSDTGSPLYDRQPPPATLPESSGSSLRRGNLQPSGQPPVRPPIVPKYDRIALDSPSPEPHAPGILVGQGSGHRSYDAEATLR